MARKWGRKKDKPEESGQPSADAGLNRPGYKIDHVVVSTGKSKTKPKFDLSKFSKRQKITAAALAVVILGAIAGAALYITRDKPAPPIAPGPKCTYRMLEAAKPNFDPTKVMDLEKQVKEIEAIPGYDADTNCLYVALTYYINLSDPKKSRELYDKLEKTYNPLEGYETIIVDVAQKPEQLKPIVEFLEQQAEMIQQNGFYGPKAEP
jgi:hypothetical protein